MNQETKKQSGAASPVAQCSAAELRSESGRQYRAGNKQLGRKFAHAANQCAGTVVVEVRCTDDDCGMVSAYRFWGDGSNRAIFRACWHTKKIPTLSKIRELISDQPNKKVSHAG